MDYLVHTSGEVSKIHNKAYVVKAKSEKEAQEIARQNFEKEFSCSNVDIQAESYARTKRAIAACIFILIAIVISFFSYSYNEKTLIFINTTKAFSIKPEMISCIFSVIFYSVYVIRFKGIKNSVGTPIDIVFTILNVLLFSSVFQLILCEKTLKIFGFIPLPNSTTVLVVTIIAALLGVKLVSVGCVAFIMIATVSNLSTANQAMGVLGVIYIISTFVGILLYLSVEPAVLEALPKMGISFSNIFKAQKKDFLEAKSEAENILDNITKR